MGTNRASKVTDTTAKHGFLKDKAVGIVFNPRVPETQGMTSAIVERLRLADKTWICPAADVESASARAASTGLIITVGGDGTILRAVRLAAPHGIPILGINFGRVGFMTELKADEALEKLPRYLEGEGWVEERAMLQAEVLTQAMEEGGTESTSGFPAFHALNDVVVGRGAVSRLVQVRVSIDSAFLTTYRADAVIVATATGSTAYSLSAGGPILHPLSGEIILKPVACHLGLAAALLVPHSARIQLTVERDGQSMLSVDGHVDLALSEGDSVKVQQSPYVARFLRARPSNYFYESLLQRLGMDYRRGGTRPTS